MTTRREIQKKRAARTASLRRRLGGRPVRREAMPPLRSRGRGGADPFEDELEDEFDLDSILDVDDEDLVFEEGEEEPGACPPGCAPVEEDEDKDKPEDEDEEEKEEKDAEGDDAEGEEEDEDKKEAAVEDEPAAEPAAEPDTAAEPVVEAAADEPEAAPAAEPVVEATAAPEPVEEPKEQWAPLLTEAQLEELEGSDITMILHSANAADPHYVMMAAGQPLCEIRQSDLNLDDRAKPMFVDESFGRAVASGIDSLGLRNALADLSPRYYALATTPTAEADRAKAEVQGDYEQAYQARVAETKTKVMDLMSLAFEASRKNFIVENPLRDSMRKALRQAGITDAVAVDLFESAMQESGADFIKNAMTQVNEWLGFEEAAIEQVRKTIVEANYSHPGDRGVPIAPEPVEAAPQRPPIATAPPVQQRSARSEGSDWDADEALVRGAFFGSTAPRR